MIVLLNQFDKRWAKVKMTPSNLTLGRFGCLVASLCMLSDYFNCFVIPPQAIDNQVKLTKDGYLIWEKLNFEKFKFEKRIRYYDPVTIADSLKDPNKAVCLNINNGGHWVVGIRKDLFGNYVVADPLGGIKRTIKAKEVVGSGHVIKK